MRPDVERLSRDAPNPVPGVNATTLTLGTALLLGATLGLFVAVSYPAASAVTGAAVLGARYGARPLVGRLRRAVRDRGASPVCVPRTDVCLEV